MNKEIQPINQLSTEQLIQQRDRTLQTIGKREYHIGQIGQCKIKYGSSFENSLELGRRLTDAKGRLEPDQNYLKNLEQELAAYNQAQQYLTTKKLREIQLGEMSQMVTQGNIPPEIFQQHQNEYQELVSLSETDPVLKSGLARIRQETERKEESRETKPTTGYKFKGKSAQLINCLKDSSPDNPITSDQITKNLYPGVSSDKARHRLSTLLSFTREKLQETGSPLGIVVVSNHYERGRGEKAKYYLSSMKQPNPVSESTQPEERKSTKNPSDTPSKDTPVISQDDERIVQINEPEFGTLSRTDIDMINLAISLNRDILETILKASGVRLIEQQTMLELLNITDGISPYDCRKMTEEKSRVLRSSLITSALQKAKKLIESPEADKVLEEIYKINPNVYFLLVNLSEMNDKLEGEVSDENNCQVTKQGIPFLIYLVRSYNNDNWSVYTTDKSGQKRKLFIKNPRNTVHYVYKYEVGIYDTVDDRPDLD